MTQNLIDMHKKSPYLPETTATGPVSWQEQNMTENQGNARHYVTAHAIKWHFLKAPAVLGMGFTEL